MRFYLDYNATAPLRPEARAAVVAALDQIGNPSSIHFEGRAARALVEEARREVAALAGASPREVVFTASGTEAANLVLAPGVSAPGVAPLGRLVVAAAEHPCVLGGHRFPSAEVAPVGPDGRLDLEALRRLLDDGPPALVALQGANNETGALQPVAEAAELTHAHAGLLVCDAAQVAGRLPLAEIAQGADALLLSAHKFGGPKGAGAIVGLREGLRVEPLLRGGGQERGRRAGTENVAAIAGFGAAARAATAGLAEEAERVAALRDACEARLRALAPQAVIFAEGAPRLPNTFAFALPGLAAATLLMRLDLDGVAASSGSACSSGKVTPSHVLAAMGVAPALAAGAIRVSLGWASGEGDVAGFAAALEKALVRRKAG
jgi:cysteine desulfurase